MIIGLGSGRSDHCAYHKVEIKKKKLKKKKKKKFEKKILKKIFWIFFFQKSGSLFPDSPDFENLTDFRTSRPVEPYWNTIT